MLKKYINCKVTATADVFGHLITRAPNRQPPLPPMEGGTIFTSMRYPGFVPRSLNEYNY